MTILPLQAATLAYKIRNSLYLNITNRCSNICIFCPKFKEYNLYGNDLLLKSEPSFEEVMSAIGEPVGIDEIVFCGFGESLLRLDLLVHIAKELKRRYNYRIRINTDGQANLVYGRNIIPDLVGLVDCISVSLNAPDAATYTRLCNTPFGADAINTCCDFQFQFTVQLFFKSIHVVHSLILNSLKLPVFFMQPGHQISVRLYPQSYIYPELFLLALSSHRSD